MAEDWAQIAAEVDEALAEVADVSQPNGFPVTLRKITAGDAWDPDAAGTPAYTTFRAVQETRELRDANGALIGQTATTLMLSATAGVVPSEGDSIAIGVTAEEAETFAGPWQAIGKVRPLAPAGIAVLYAIDLQG